MTAADFANVEWSRKNREAGRPFIEHQLETMDFYVGLQQACAQRNDLRLIHPDELVAAFPDQNFNPRNPFALHVKVSHGGAAHEVGVVPDFAFGLAFANGSRRCFLVEIDRGTMPITRADIDRTSLERKMRGYLAAHATRQHERRFGWRTFRVLTVTTDWQRAKSAREALRSIRVASGPGPALFFFATRTDLIGADALTCDWNDGNDRSVRLI